jgi:DDE superfamily endonuclease
MPILPAELLNLIVVFEPLFSKSVWATAQILLLGALLTPGKRTVTACLRVVGLSQEPHFQNYHRVLNRAKWSAFDASRILLGLLILLVPTGSAIVIGGDDTIERRRGPKIKGASCYRDPVRSSKKHVIRCFGLKWLSMMVLIKLPWSSRVWALPFLTVLCRPQAKGQPAKVWATPRRHQTRQAKKRKAQAKTVGRSKLKAQPRQHKTVVDLLMILIRKVHRWVPERLVVLVVDGGYAAVKLALVCAQTPNLALVTRLRWDAALYHPPAPRAQGQRGRDRLKGARQPSPRAWAARRDADWEQIELDWYKGSRKKMKLFSRTALWYTQGESPVWIRYVIARDPEGVLRDELFACTKLDATPAQIIEWVVMRWSVETTFQEARALLGLETQRQWSELAIVRTTPCLLGLFSLVVLLTHRLQPDGQVPLMTASWYEKAEATFSDCMVLVRKHLWRSFNYSDSAQKADSVYLPAQAWEHLLSCLAAAA